MTSNLEVYFIPQFNSKNYQFWAMKAYLKSIGLQIDILEKKEPTSLGNNPNEKH